MALASDGAGGGQRARIAVFGPLSSGFDPISGGPGAITAAHGPRSSGRAPRFKVPGPRPTAHDLEVKMASRLTSTGWSRGPSAPDNWHRPRYRGPRIAAP